VQSRRTGVIPPSRFGFLLGISAIATRYRLMGWHAIEKNRFIGWNPNLWDRTIERHTPLTSCFRYGQYFLIRPDLANECNNPCFPIAMNCSYGIAKELPARHCRTIRCVSGKMLPNEKERIQQQGICQFSELKMDIDDIKFISNVIVQLLSWHTLISA